MEKKSKEISLSDNELDQQMNGKQKNNKLKRNMQSSEKQSSKKREVDITGSRASRKRSKGTTGTAFMKVKTPVLLYEDPEHGAMQLWLPNKLDE